MKTVVKMFQPRFAQPVVLGAKLQTIRPTPKRMPEVGDRISLRTWSGKPYRSKQLVLGEGKIIRVASLRLSRDQLVLGNRIYTGSKWQFATQDGFSSWGDMCDWFEVAHGLPFEGILICWRLIKACTECGASPIWGGKDPCLKCGSPQ